MPERDGKDQGEDSPEQAGSCWFARHSCLATSYILQADVMFCLSLAGCYLRLFCFLSLPLSASFFISVSAFFCFFEDVAFSECVCTITVFLFV